MSCQKEIEFSTEPVPMICKIEMNKYINAEVQYNLYRYDSSFIRYEFRQIKGTSNLTFQLPPIFSKVRISMIVESDSAALINVSLFVKGKRAYEMNEIHAVDSIEFSYQSISLYP